MATGIIEKVSTTGGAGYCKYADGTLICYGDFTASPSNERSWGNGVIADFEPAESFAVSFISLPSVTISHRTHYAAMICDSTFDRFGISKVQMARLSAFPSGDFVFDYVAVGRWK